ncbi:MAG: outer membrane lipoprotein carrier protein LolA [Myxococcales bacterium]|nr:outer membrane lipoprotein carrier protein LolA [Myxococcales bacterium]
MIDRRTWLLALPALALPALARPALALPPDELSPQDRKLANRLELWASYAGHTRNLMTRLSTRRETSLLEEPLLSTGTLVFVAPQLLVLRDDGRQGSTTLIDGEDVRVFLNGAGRRDPSATVASQRPAARWLAARLRLMFAPGDGTALLEETRTHVPKGLGHRLELMPLRGSAARRSLRSVSLQLDPVVGTITQIVVAEAQGDRVVMGLTDHRQNLPDEDITAFLDQLDA